MSTKSPSSKFNPSAAFLKRNAAFKAASKAEKRVLIAKDVLAQLKAGKYAADPGNWATVKAPSSDIEKSTEVCTIIDDPRSECSCCALGALMLSEIRLNDNLKVGKVDEDAIYNGEVQIDHNGAGDRLNRYFSDKQLRLMEIAFEQGGGSCQARTEEEFRAEKKYDDDRHEDADARLVKIMKNVVKNGGTFKP